MNHRKYFEVIERRYLEGEIDYDRYIFLIDKLTQWEYVYNEGASE